MRAISDAADEDLPINFNLTISSDKQISIPRVLVQLAKNPLALPALIRFGQQSRKELKQLVEAFPAQEWDVPHEWNILTFSVTASPRKIVMHVLMHEIRHWAQIATLFRLNGLAVEFHDLLFSPVSGFNP